MNTDFLVFIFPALTIFLLLLGGYKLLFEKQVQAQERIRNRLDPAMASAVAQDGKSDKLLKRRSNAKNKKSTARLEIKLERANLMIRTEEFFLISLGVAVGGLVLGMFILRHNALLMIIDTAIGAVLPYGYVMMRLWLRHRKAGEQFAEVLDAMVNSFKTGFGFNRAVQMIADNYDDPWGTEFGKMAVELSLGSTQEDALQNLRKRMPMTDVDLFIAALLIQKETGGNLAELLGNLSKTCRERFKLYRKISAISAQGKLSAGIICMVPFGLTTIMYLFLPGATMEFVTNPIGIVMLVLAGIWMSFGIGVLFKIVSIEV